MYSKFVLQIGLCSADYDWPFNDCVKSYAFSINTLKVLINKIGLCIVIQTPN